MSARAIDRRCALKAIAALTASTLGPAALAQSPRGAQAPAPLPNRGEYLIRDATVLSMDDAILHL